ncbi:5'-3' exonuclease [Luteipulveratus sp. YIM 133132]|uniref:5'-3' exonuclease n=1 Tax=Luteipulveratus flavus TaxID=3031728 RepID=A0ABT6CBD9_9MICO|nr:MULTISPECIES: 5'-3' exonuclease [unclassified Luteipulveratus]MDE9367409.1 5'-3' exonuclease [Luteipulveratus sp. YIM 133132]MDF8266210.1 5'-3' exonuclease [Luteipulveratus sp. YIM 133296]
MPRSLMLLDSASLYFRAFYGVPDRRPSAEAPPNNAIRGFADMIATLVTTYRPTDLVACWDNDWRPAFRVEAIPSYKAHRAVEGTEFEEESPEELTPQVPVIRDMLAALGITRLGVDGYEADDVIGTLTHRAHGSSTVDVVTGDRDLFQLVDDQQSVRILYTARGGVREPDLVDESWLHAKYGIAGGRAYADMAVLRGDSSDGLPGVAGVGEKTAVTLINRYGSLAALREAIDGGDPMIKGAQRKRLEEAAAYLDVAPAVVDVALDVPVPADLSTALPASPTDEDALDHIAEVYDAHTPLQRVRDALAKQA